MIQVFFSLVQEEKRKEKEERLNLHFDNTKMGVRSRKGN
jgi:hypothetical protein